MIITALLLAQLNIEQYHQRIPTTDGLHGSVFVSIFGKNTTYTSLDTTGVLNISYRLNNSLFLASSGGSFYFDNHKFSRNNEYMLK
jgi:hypothetical protein